VPVTGAEGGRRRGYAVELDKAAAMQVIADALGDTGTCHRIRGRSRLPAATPWPTRSGRSGPTA